MNQQVMFFCGELWGVTEWSTPEDNPICHYCLNGEPALLPLRGQAAEEGGDLLLGDILPSGPDVI